MKNNFKAILCVILGVVLMFSAVACNNNGGGENPAPSDYNRPSNPTIDTTFEANSNVLAAYFSKTNTTEAVANTIADYTGADLFEIERKEPYPDAYTPTTEEAEAEKEANARPELARYLSDEVMAEYDTIFLGFPIWWHTAPMAVLSFLNYYDLSGKTVITFCTSGSSPITESTADIRGNTEATVIEGSRFSRSDDAAIHSWIDSLSLNIEQPEPNEPEQPNVGTESLTYELNASDDTYTVTGMSGDEGNIVIPAVYDGKAVTVIGESAFAYSRHNADIFSVTIPDSVTTIERNAFYNRDEMTTVNISSNSQLTTIGNNAFSGNHSLTSIYIPSTVTSIGDNVFNNDGAINFTVAQGNTVYRSENGHLIESATNTLIRGGQSGEVPSGITEIAQAAFRNSSAITELIIPTSVTAIGNYFIADSRIATIRFMGTEEEWNSIEKSESMWNYGNREVELKFKTEASILIVYFTAESGNTERVANYIHSQIGGDIVKIEAAQPYTSQDLNYSIPNNRPEVEKAENARPEISRSTYDQIDMNKYDTVFIGYPIWWWTAPMIIGTFLEHYDLTGVDVYPFSQSASMNAAQFDTSVEFVRECAAKEGTPTIHDGLFARATSTSTINAYLTANGFVG